MQIFSFEPIVAKNPKILILGTMPGKKSLELAEYYAHKTNVFRKIIFTLFNEKISFDYEHFITVLTKNNIALWDTLMLCQRQGSADSAIEQEIPNDIKAIYLIHIIDF